jgi:hypothetical protein
MSEIRLLVDQMKLTYEGIFDLKGLYQLIGNYFYERGWDFYEKLNTEQVFSSGKMVKIEMTPFKNVTDYYQIRIRIRLMGTGIKPIDIDQEGAKIPLQDGTLRMVFDGYVKTDRYDKWEQRPFQWFVRTLMDKYVFKAHYSKAEQWLYSDVEDLYARIKTFLNVYRHARDRGRVAPQVL